MALLQKLTKETVFIDNKLQERSIARVIDEDTEELIGAITNFPFFDPEKMLFPIQMLWIGLYSEEGYFVFDLPLQHVCASENMAIMMLENYFILGEMPEDSDAVFTVTAQNLEELVLH
jgi:hypothetical protein